MKPALLSLILAPTLATIPLTAPAEEVRSDDPLKLDDIVVTANRKAQPRSETPAAVTVFTRADIDRLQPSSVADLLNRVSGVQMTQSGGRGSVTSLFIRGTKTAQSLVLIDGMRVGSVSAGGANLQYLDPDQIERVEVLRGSRSAVYGADAIGGVVQIFTRRGNGNGITPRVRLAVGNHGDWQRSVGVSGGNARTRFSLNSSLNELQGIDRTRHSFDTDSDHDAFRNRSLSFTLSHEFTESLRMGLNVLDQRGKTEYDSTFMPNSEPYNRFTLNSYSGYLEGDFTESWTSRFELGHSEDKLTTKDKRLADKYVYNSYRDSAAWLNTLQLGGGHSLLVGFDFLNDRLHNSDNSLYSTTFDRKSRWNRAGFIQHDFKSEYFSTQLGLRHDKNQQYGSENTWNAALMVPIGQNNEVTFSYAEGFRVPTFNDAYYPGSGNANLSPEHSKSYEVQWRSQLTPTTRLETSIYRTNLKDMIAYVPIPGTWFGKNYNVDKARINGFEASLQQRLLGWDSALNLSMIDPQDRKTGHTLQNRARRTLSLDLDRQFGNLSFGGTWQAVSSSYGDAKNDVNIPGYGLLGLRGSWQATQELKFDLKLDNVLNRRYYRNTYSFYSPGSFMPDYYGYREEGRTVLFAVTWTPKL